MQNVLAAGSCELKTVGGEYQLAPKVVRDPTRRRFPIPVRLILALVGTDQYMGAFKNLVLPCDPSLQSRNEPP